ncbi:MAG: hypothetical protein K8R41_04905 [Bacteroidales bacterium]|nr:hypothetical protein [Bacteroidales bacterium]
MKRFIIPFFVIISLVLVFNSCNKDCEIETPDFYGSWTVLQFDDLDQQYNVELKFNSNNSYDWILLDTVEGHNNSHAEFTISGNLMSITNDLDCNSVGEYYLTVEANKLAIIAKTDGCAQRAAALEWVWKKK